MDVIDLVDISDKKIIGNLTIGQFSTAKSKFF